MSSHKLWSWAVVCQDGRSRGASGAYRTHMICAISSDAMNSVNVPLAFAPRRIEWVLRNARDEKVYLNLVLRFPVVSYWV
jgi:hypothetical protein